MKKIIILLFIATISCNKNQTANNGNVIIDSICLADNNVPLNWDIQEVPQSLSGYTPEMVTGNWKGDGKTDTLYVCYYSRALNRAIASPLFLYGDKISYDELVERTMKLDPVIYIINKNNVTDTVATIDAGGQLFGLYFMDNKGDLDGDGGDELLYLVNYADWSSTNTYYIFSYKENKWNNLFDFPVWEWQFENGDENVIKKMPDHKIEITFRNEEAMEETKIVDLSKIRNSSIIN